MTIEPLLIELRTGHAAQPGVGLTPGQTVEAFSVGTQGAWAVDGPGIDAEHAYLYFDGESLFISSTDAQNPAWVNGQAAGLEWQQVHAPSEIALGGVLLWFGRESDRAVDRPPPPAPSPPARHIAQPVVNLAAPPVPGPPPAFVVAAPSGRPEAKKLKLRSSARKAIADRAPDDEAETRFQPIGADGGAGLPPMPAGEEATVLHPLEAGVAAPAGPARMDAAPLPAAGMPPMGGAAPFASAPRSLPEAPPEAAPWPVAQPAAPPSAGESPFGPPLPGMAPIAGPNATSKTQRIGSVGEKLKSSWREASIPQKAILVLMPFAFVAMFVLFDKEEEIAPRRSSQPIASASVAPVPAAATEPAGEPTAGSASGAVPAPPASSAAPPARAGAKEKTLERRAADAVAAGSYAEALELYRELSQEHPDKPAYLEAARILRERVEAGGQ